MWHIHMCDMHTCVSCMCDLLTYMCMNTWHMTHWHKCMNIYVTVAVCCSVLQNTWHMSRVSIRHINTSHEYVTRMTLSQVYIRRDTHEWIIYIDTAFPSSPKRSCSPTQFIYTRLYTSSEQLDKIMDHSTAHIHISIHTYIYIYIYIYTYAYIYIYI